MIEPRPLAESAALAQRRAADAIIVTGYLTGVPPDPGDLRTARQGAGDVPVLIGSGLDDANAAALVAEADGAIVGTSLKTGQSIDALKVRRLMERVREARGA